MCRSIYCLLLINCLVCELDIQNFLFTGQHSQSAKHLAFRTHSSWLFFSFLFCDCETISIWVNCEVKNWRSFLCFEPFCFKCKSHWSWDKLKVDWANKMGKLSWTGQLNNSCQSSCKFVILLFIFVSVFCGTIICKRQQIEEIARRQLDSLIQTEDYLAVFWRKFLNAQFGDWLNVLCKVHAWCFWYYMAQSFEVRLYKVA